MPEHTLNVEEPEQSALPPTDGGFEAWLLLAGCFVVNVLIWGTSIRDRFLYKSQDTGTH